MSKGFVPPQVDTLLDKLKSIKSLPFLRSIGIEDIIDAAYKTIKFLHDSVKAHTLTIDRLEKQVEDNRVTIAVLQARLEGIEKKVYKE